MNQELSLYQVKALSYAGAHVDWEALVGKIPGARTVRVNETNCILALPEDAIAALDTLLQKEYHSVHRTQTNAERMVSVRRKEERHATAGDLARRFRRL